MPTTEKYQVGSTVTLLSTELNSLASSSTNSAISATVFNNTAAGGSLDGFTLCTLELRLAAPAGVLTANTAANVWFLATVDGGTTYEDGSAAVLPARIPDAVFPVRSVSTVQVMQRRVMLPPGNWFVLVNQGTGQTWAASGNTLKVSPVSRQGV